MFWFQLGDGVGLGSCGVQAELPVQPFDAGAVEPLVHDFASPPVTKRN